MVSADESDLMPITTMMPEASAENPAGNAWLDIPFYSLYFNFSKRPFTNK